MPRGPRLDAPGALHHVMARGLDRQTIFRNDRDREDFVRRLADLAHAGALVVYAWALLPNHFHLLVRTANRPLPRAMRSLLTGYAGAFNRRHRRSGHLFQNRIGKITPEALLGGGRRRDVSHARDGLAYLWVGVLGRSGREVAQELRIRPESIYKGARRGEKEQQRWRRALGV